MGSRDATAAPRMSPAADRSDLDADSQSMLGLFAFLLALALILHQLWWDGFDARHPLVMAAAAWTLLRPTSLLRFSSLLAAEVIAVWRDMPEVGDHILLVGLSGACLLGHWVASALRERCPPTAGEIWEAAAPFLRASALIVYAFAALSKMNGDFLDPELSCAATMSANVTWFDPSLLGSWRVEPAIWSTILIEATLPVLLAVRRTRGLGLVLGVGFHVVLALAGNVPFAAVMLALYSAFLPADAPSRVRALFAGGRASGVLERARRRPPWFDPAALLVLAAGWLLADRLAAANATLAGVLLEEVTRATVVAIAVVAAALALATRRRGRRPARPARSRPRIQAVFAVGIALLAINGLSPYLGLKSATSFNMFSNLRTEPGRWNHELIPEAVRIFGAQDHLVRVVRSNDPWLQRSADDGGMLVEAEVERYVRQHPYAHATVSSSDMPGPTARAPMTRISSTGAALLSTQSVIDKLAKFRPVPAEGIPGC